MYQFSVRSRRWKLPLVLTPLFFLPPIFNPLSQDRRLPGLLVGIPLASSEDLPYFASSNTNFRNPLGMLCAQYLSYTTSWSGPF